MCIRDRIIYSCLESMHRPRATSLPATLVAMVPVSQRLQLPDTMLTLFSLLLPSDERQFLLETISWRRCNSAVAHGPWRLRLSSHCAAARIACFIDFRSCALRTFPCPKLSSIFTWHLLVATCRPSLTYAQIRRRKIIRLPGHEKN